ncbi:MAG: histidine phosphatase family protein [Candidatus Yanofskybacteria bacterium]|nr:histidine phosphatase family protein [Candidatus Yanofskybacteria bacterium]
MLPIDTIFVRHGQSEGNVANKASRTGDNTFFTPDFRERHSRAFRLTNKGIDQAKSAGEWLRANIQMPLDRFYVSDYIRAKETAAYLDLPQAEWRVEYQLRERDKALMDNCPVDEQKKMFELEEKQYRLDPFLSYPAGGGESIPMLCLRLKADFVEHLARECFDKRVVVVCHGHVMRAIQLELENLGHDDFIRLDSSENDSEKIRNCQILWYSRRDPDTNKINSHLVAVRSICPWDPKGDYGWRKIQRTRYSNEGLHSEVNKYPRHANS